MFNSNADQEDHLYDFNTNIDTGIAATGTAFKGPNTAFKPLTAANRGVIGSSMGRNNQQPPASRGGVPASRAGLTTGQVGVSGESRPMTSVSGAGYKGSKKENKAFDPFNLGKGPAPPLAEKSENSFEDKAKDMEKKVHRLIEASAAFLAEKETMKALEKAKEAGRAERALCKFRDGHNLSEHINLDLTYAICFNLANAYHHNKMYEDAINTYQMIVKNKQYPQSGRLRVNMGNIYYEQKKYPQAIKMYRMALDQIPSTGKELRFRIFRNIGNSFVKLGQFQDAIDSYETIMQGSADIQTAFNLLLCLYARGDKEKMERHFLKMLTIPVPGMTEGDEEDQHHDDDDNGESKHDVGSDRVDALKEDLKLKVELTHERLLTAARLIAPVIDERDDWEAGYKWIVEQFRQDHEAVCSRFEIDLAMQYMKRRRFDDSTKLLKEFEKKDANLRAMAATNLSFIYFLEGDFAQAEKHADIAMKSDRYNAKALVNKGNCLFYSGQLDNARAYYLEAVGVEADCVEAIYNLGLVNMKMNNYTEAKSAFEKLHAGMSNMPEALYHLASIAEKGDEPDLEEAAKTFEVLLNKVPGDPTVCCRLGQLHEKLGDDNTACHWHGEAHRYFPVNLNVTSWLGVWYVKRELYEQAIEYFQQAALVQPSEVKWQLMVTSCYRRLGDYYKALELYTQIHEQHPDNIESLQYLEALCKELGRPCEEYSKKLEKLRRNQPAATQSGATAATQASAAPERSAAPQRDARPERSERAGRSERPGKPAAEEKESSSGRSPMPAPRAGASQFIRPNDSPSNSRNARPAPADEDDFADTDVADLLV